MQMDGQLRGSRLRLLAQAAAAWLCLLASWPSVTVAQRYLPTAHPDNPMIKYADSLVSLNDRCAVRSTPMSLTVKPVYVNGRPVGFC